MNIYFDTEFTGLHQATTLISIGLVAATGETFYAECSDYNNLQVNHWIKDNVIANLLYDKVPGYKVISNDIKHYRIKCSAAGIAAPLTRWLAQLPLADGAKHIIWADVPAYDWVLFCQLFGGALAIPDNIYYAPADVSTLLTTNGMGDVNREEYVGHEAVLAAQAAIAQPDASKKHNALYDALICKAVHEKVMIKEQNLAYIDVSEFSRFKEGATNNNDDNQFSRFKE